MTETLTKAVESQQPRVLNPQSRRLRVGRYLVQRFFNIDVQMTLLSLSLIIFAWALVGEFAGLPTYVLPSPLDVLDATGEFRDALWDATLATTWEVGIGFVAATLIAIPLALCIAFSRLIERLIYPITVGAQSVPKVAIAPIFLVWFGFGTTPKILIATLMAFFPIVIDTVVGLRSIDPDMVNMAKVTGAGRIKIFFKLRVPTALPSIFSGLKVAATLAVTGAVVGEFVAGTTGLGYIIQSAQGLQQTALAFNAIIILAVLSLIFFYALELIERLMLRGSQQ